MDRIDATFDRVAIVLSDAAKLIGVGAWICFVAWMVADTIASPPPDGWGDLPSGFMVLILSPIIGVGVWIYACLCFGAIFLPLYGAAKVAGNLYSRLFRADSSGSTAQCD